MSLAGKRALVSGGSGHIGGAICKALAAAGAEVVVHAHRGLDRAEALSSEIKATGGRAEVLTFDITDSEAARRALEKVSSERAYQIVVHAAGIHDDGPLAGMSAERWQRVIDVSLNGFFNVVQPVLLPMVRTRWGRIVAISSISGILGNRGQANYAAAKSGLHGAVKSLALEYAIRGITCNVVAPGVIATPDTSVAFSDEQISALVPMKRSGTPKEVAQLVRFLASDQASYITGQIISISGGLG